MLAVAPFRKFSFHAEHNMSRLLAETLFWEAFSGMKSRPSRSFVYLFSRKIVSKSEISFSSANKELPSRFREDHKFHYEPRPRSRVKISQVFYSWFLKIVLSYYLFGGFSANERCGTIGRNRPILISKNTHCEEKRRMRSSIFIFVVKLNAVSNNFRMSLCDIAFPRRPLIHSTIII